MHVQLLYDEPREYHRESLHLATSMNQVPYDAPSMQQRDWVAISLMPLDAILFGRPFPHCMFALMENEPDIVMLFDGPGEFDKLHYYLDHKTSIHKKYKIRQIDAPLDYHFYEPDAGYSYRWEDGTLIEGSYMDRILNHRHKQVDVVTEA